jgi:hypothetical protein
VKVRPADTMIEHASTGMHRSERLRSEGVVYIEQGASWLVEAALAATQVRWGAPRVEAPLRLLARSANAGPGSLTFMVAQSSSDELRQQLYALVEMLTEQFPQANVCVRFVPGPDDV